MFASSLLRDGKHNWLFSHSPRTWEERRTLSRACGKLSPFRSLLWMKNLSFQSPLHCCTGWRPWRGQLSFAQWGKTPKICAESLLRPKFALNTTGEAPAFRNSNSTIQCQGCCPYWEFLVLNGEGLEIPWNFSQTFLFGLKTIMKRDRKADFRCASFNPAENRSLHNPGGDSLGQTTSGRHMPWILEYTAIQLSRCLERHQHWKLQEEEQRNTQEAALARNKLCPGTRQLKVAS